MYRDDLEEGPGPEGQSAGTLGVPVAVGRRRSRALSQVEVEGLKDLLGDIDDDASTTDEEREVEEE